MSLYFSWLGVLKALLALANGIADIVRERQLMQAGEDRAMAKQLTAIAQRLEISDAIRAEVEAMSEGDLDEELRQ